MTRSIPSPSSTSCPSATPWFWRPRIGYFGEYELHLFGEIARKQSVIDALGEAADGKLPRRRRKCIAGNDDRDGHPEPRAGRPARRLGLRSRTPVDDRLPQGEPAIGRGARAREALGSPQVRADARRRKRPPASGTSPSSSRTTTSAASSPRSIRRPLGRSVALAYLSEDLAIPGLTCAVGPERRTGETVSAPAFLGRSILDSLG